MRNRYTSTRRAALFAAALSLATAATAPPVHAAAVVKIGSSSPLTGSSALHGIDMVNGMRLAIDEANAQNIKVGGEEVTFVVAPEDDQSDPRTGVAVARKLVDDKDVVAVVGTYNSGVALAAANVYARAGIPLVDPAATNPKITQLGFRNIFRIILTDEQNSGNAGKYAVAVLKGKRIATLDDRTPFGQGETDAFKKAVLAAGGRIIDEEFTSDKAVSFTAQLTKIQSVNADVLFFGGLGQQPGLVVKQMKQLGMARTQFLGGGAIADSVFTQIAGGAADGALAMEYGQPLDHLPRGKEFADKYKAKFGIDNLLYSPFSYDATWIIINAIREAGSIKPADFMPRIASVNYRGVTSTITLDENGDLKHPVSTLYKHQGGEWVPIASFSN